MLRLLAAASIALVSCSGKDGGGGPGAGEDPDGVCASEEQRPVFFAGMEERGSEVAVTLVEADPAPPRLGDNTWTLEVATLDGTSLPDARITVVPWMIQHNHGSPAEVAVSDEGSGAYVAAPVNFSMPGYWETTVRVRLGDVDEEIIFGFCAE